MTAYQWTADDADAYIAFCAALGIADRTIPLHVWANESDNSPCPPRNGPAVGICQFEPDTLRGLGYNLAADPHLDAFVAMSVAEQLVWALKYYASERAYLGTVAGFYCVTFVPARAHLAWDPNAVVCGERPGDPYPGFYRANSGFDRTKRGAIVMQDLTDAANRQYGPRAQSIAKLVASRVDTVPDVT